MPPLGLAKLEKLPKLPLPVPDAILPFLLQVVGVRSEMEKGDMLGIGGKESGLFCSVCRSAILEVRKVISCSSLARSTRCPFCILVIAWTSGRTLESSRAAFSAVLKESTISSVLVCIRLSFFSLSTV